MSTRTRGNGVGGGRRTRPRVAEAPTKWPSEVPKTCIDKKGNVRDVPPFPSHSPLHGLEQRIWGALAHVDPRLFSLERKEPAFREALSLVGMGWVATNEGGKDGVRTAKGALFDAAKRHLPPGEPLPEIKEVEVKDVEWDCKEMGELEFVIVKHGRNDDVCAFPTEMARSVKECLDGTGMCVIRGAVDKPTVRMLRSGIADDGCHPDAAKIEEIGSFTKIMETTGNGTAGEAIFERKGKPIGSYYNDALKKSVYLDRLQHILVQSLKEDATVDERVVDGRKYILLNYSTGGENYAHRDGGLEKSFPYQALLMLSDSEEYDGGSFYLAERSKTQNGDGKFVRTCAPKLDAGDLVIFQAAKEGVYSHGMKALTRGERVAVGLLQK